MTFIHAAACRRTILVAATLLLLGVPAGDLRGAPPGDSASRRPVPRYVADEILLAFKADARPNEIQAILKDLGAKRMRAFKRTRVERHKIGRPVEEAVARFKGHRAIQFIEPNYLLTAEATPNDPSFSLQWSLRNTGQNGGTPSADIDAVAAWDRTTGSSQVVVAIIDTGMDLDHADLAANLYTNPGEIPGNGLDDDGNGLADDAHGFDFANFDPDPTDDSGHGTHVAGIIGAVGNNALGISGVAWSVRLLPLKFLDAGGSGSTGDAIDCIDYAVAAGATAINASWGGGDFSEALRLAIVGAHQAGTLFIAAAGNSGSDNDEFAHYPSNFDVPNVIAVASTGSTDTRSPFSSYGATTVDLFAPGGQILSTLPDGAYGFLSGTSMAAPHVTGAVALLKSRFPGMPGPTIKTVTLGATDRVAALGGLSATGGRLNVAHMMDGADSIAPAPVVDLALGSASSDRVTVRWTATGDDGSTGTATTYDLRFATSLIDEANFGTATRVTGLPAPRPVGSAEQASASGLVPLTDYWLALRTIDEFGNASALSNVLRVRTTGPPTLEVSPGSLSSALQTGLRDTLGVQVRNGGEGSLDFTASVAAAGSGPAPSWLSVAPVSGAVPQGGSVDLSVRLTAAGLPGGNHEAVLRLATNDPARRTFDLPVTLQITPAPDILVEPLPLFFGPVAVGSTESIGLLISNLGFADLHVRGFVLENADFAADTTGFDLPPGGSWEVLVSVTPSNPGPTLGAITLTCDDPDEGIVRVPLGATGIVPAAAALAPERLDASLHTGATAQRTLTISNTGGSSLSWAVRARARGADGPTSPEGRAATSTASPPDATPGPAAEAAGPADLSDVRLVFDAGHGADAGPWAAMLGSLTSRGAVTSVNGEPITEQILSTADIYWIVDGPGTFEPAELEALGSWVRRGGSVLLEGDAAAALPSFNAALSAVGAPVAFHAADGLPGPTQRVYPFEITRGAVQASLPGANARLGVTGPAATILLEDAAGAPAMAATFVERGRVLAVAGRLFADVSANFPDNRLLASQSFDWLGGAVWLSATPAFGSTPAGLSTNVTIRFDADHLAGAEYRGTLVLRSNDPSAPVLSIPVDLSVTSAPDVEASPSALAFGTVLVGASGRDSVRVRNVGTAPLRARSVSASPAEFSTTADSFMLAPGASRWLVVRYAPSAPTPASGSLTVETDDPDEPTVVFALSGSGAPAPDVDLDLTPIHESLATGGSSTRTLTLANRTGSDLQFTATFVEETPASAMAVETARMPSLAGRWIEARAAAASRAQTGGARVSSGAAQAPASVDTLPLVVIDPRGDGGISDFLVLRSSARDGALRVEMTTSTEIVPRNFGGFLSLDLDQNPNTGRSPSFGNPRQDIGAELELGLFSVGFGIVDLLDARTGNYLESFPVEVESHAVRFSIPLSSLQNDEGRMNVSGVIGNSLDPTDWYPDRRHGTVGGLWLTATPSSGRVTAGAATTLTLIADARGLGAGTYPGSLLVETNDPDELLLSVPASLTVADGPVLAVTTLPIRMAATFVGDTTHAELALGNSGTAPLTIAIASDLDDYSVDPSALSIEPGATRALRVTFAPRAAGSREAVLTITHDAPGGPVAIGVTGDASVAPIVRLTPEAIHATADPGGGTVATLRVQNDGGSPLSYGVDAVLSTAPPVEHQALQLARDAEDPRDGIRGLGMGGPDPFGYRWVDSGQPGGPAFDWQDISAVGTPVPIKLLDENSGPLPIGFEFPFYGKTFTTFNVCTHGWISFTSTRIEYLNQPLPTDGVPENLLAVFWDDLNFGGVERATYHNDGTRLIVQFTNVLRRARGGPFTFQVILYPNGTILYQYLLMGTPTTSGTIGIQGASRFEGLTAVFNDVYLRDRMAIRFSAAPSWLAVERPFATVESGAMDSVTVKVDARALFPGTYAAALRVSSNDPDRRTAMVPLTLRVAGVPDLVVAPETLAFDTLAVGGSAAESLRVTNVGTDRLEVTSIQADRPDFTAEPASLDLGPLQSAVVAIRFAPQSGGDRSATLTLASNDPGGPVRVPIQAFARWPERELAAELIPSFIQRGSRGQHLRARVLVPRDLAASQVDLPGVRLLGTVPPILGSTRLRDLDGDGRPDLDLAFDRASVERVLPDGDRVPVAITGEFRNTARFTARDTVRVGGKRFVAPGVEALDGAPGAATALHPNAPNPFRPETAIEFTLAEPGEALLRVYGAGGRLVRTLVRSSLPAGRYRARWDGRTETGAPAASGVYYARLECRGPNPDQASRRMVLVR